MLTYKEFTSSIIEEVKEIYKQEGWNAYLNDDKKLINAFDNSLYILGTFHNDKLIGFIRCVGDGEHILIVQDLIIHKKYQKKGIGTYLFKNIMKKYSQVRTFMVVTDLEDEIDNKFYQSFNMKKIENMNMVCYIK